MNVYLPGNIADIQGPCASGFHVPSKDEWVGLKSIIDGFSLTATDWVSKLHIPLAGMRSNNNPGNVYSQGEVGLYWSCTSKDNNNAYFCYITESSVLPTYDNYKSFGYSIRPFKNKIVLPNSTWTVIHGTLGSGGIFWDTVNGLITITSNGTTGYTISDKNLGATSYDTSSSSSYGNYYQRGNNYGFPNTGSVTTSNSQVDASSYGPGNYYSNSAYRVISPRDSSNNPNLRGGVSGGINELKNAYIGEVYEYSYDFRGKSWSQCQTDGWYSQGGTDNLDCGANGIYQKNYGTGGRPRIDLINTNISWAKKITIEAQIYASNTSSFGGQFGMFSYNSGRSYSTQSYLGSDGKNYYIAETRTTFSTTLTGNTYKYRLFIDLENKTYTYQILTGGSYSTNGTLTDTQVSNIRNNAVRGGIYLGWRGFVQTVYLKIE